MMVQGITNRWESSRGGWREFYFLNTSPKGYLVSCLLVFIEVSQADSSMVAKDPSLLDLWPSIILEGQEGDERIRKESVPDHRPPEQTAVEGALPSLKPQERESIRRVRITSDHKPIALSFDLCEQADDRTGYDRDIFNYLRSEHIPATFYAGGKWMRTHEEKLLQIMSDPLFEVGNHAWTHGNLRVLHGERMRDQIIWVQAEYQRLRGVLEQKATQKGLSALMKSIPIYPLSFRFPYGTCNAESLKTVNDLGLLAIQWDVVSGDAAKGISAKQLVRSVVQEAKPGSIVVFHANGRGYGTRRALPMIIKQLKSKGYEFVTVTALLKMGVPETASECYELSPGDNLRYDKLFGEGTE